MRGLVRLEAEYGGRIGQHVRPNVSPWYGVLVRALTGLNDMFPPFSMQHWRKRTGPREAVRYNVGEIRPEGKNVGELRLGRTATQEREEELELLMGTRDEGRVRMDEAEDGARETPQVAEKGRRSRGRRKGGRK